jgi:hypothetical protein
LGRRKWLQKSESAKAPGVLRFRRANSPDPGSREPNLKPGARYWSWFQKSESRVPNPESRELHPGTLWAKAPGALVPSPESRVPSHDSREWRPGNYRRRLLAPLSPWRLLFLPPERRSYCAGGGFRSEARIPNPEGGSYGSRGATFLPRKAVRLLSGPSRAWLRREAETVSPKCRGGDLLCFERRIPSPESRDSSYLASRSSLMMSCSAAMTSSRSTRDFVNRSCSLNAFVGAR